MLASALRCNFIRQSKFVLQPTIHFTEERKLWRLELQHVNSPIYRDESVYMSPNDPAFLAYKDLNCEQKKGNLSV